MSFANMVKSMILCLHSYFHLFSCSTLYRNSEQLCALPYFNRSPTYTDSDPKKRKKTHTHVPKPTNAKKNPTGMKTYLNLIRATVAEHRHLARSQFSVRLSYMML